MLSASYHKKTGERAIMRITEENHEGDEDDELTLTILNTNTFAVASNGTMDLRPSTTPKFRIEHYQLEIDSDKILASSQNQFARHLSTSTSISS